MNPRPLLPFLILIGACNSPTTSTGRPASNSLVGTTAVPEPAEIPPELESWYKIVQGERHVGYVRENLRKDSVTGRTAYHREEHFEITTGGTKNHFFRSVDAELGASFIPTRLKSETLVNGEESSLNLEYDNEGFWLDIRSPSGDSLVRRVSKEHIQVLPELALFDLRQGKLLQKPLQVTVRLLDLSLQPGLGAEIAIEAGETTKREYFSRSSTVTEVRFPKTYPAPLNGCELVQGYVDRFGRVVEATMKSGAKLVMVNDDAEAVGSLSPNGGKRGHVIIACSKRFPGAGWH
jgi:hypothetical protein